MKQIVKLIILIFFGYQIQAQSTDSTLLGIVYDLNSKSILQGVIVEHGKSSVQTDQDGAFKIKHSSGDSLIRFKMIGYKDLALPMNALAEGLVYMEENAYLLSTTIISASKYEQPIAEATVSTSVINRSLPERLNTISGEKVLDRIPGVQIIDGQANIRGGSGYSYGAGSRVLLLMDDMPMMQVDAANPYWNDLPVENLGQIEVLKGAASTLYGSSAMNGVVHFRSATPNSQPVTQFTIAPTVFMQPELGNHWWGRPGTTAFPTETYFSVNHRSRKGKNDLILVSSFNKEISYNRDSDADAFRFQGNLRHRISDSLLLSFGANLNVGKSSDFFYWKDAGSYEGASGANSTNEKFRLMLDPALRYTSPGAYSHKILSRYYYIFNGADNQQENKSHSVYVEYQLRKHIPKILLDVQLGGALNSNWTKAQLYSDTSFQLFSQAAYFQLEKKFWNRVIINGGVRFESYQTEGPGKLNNEDIATKVHDQRNIFRAGMNAQIFNYTYLRASVGEGFRFPSIAEKYISTTAGGLRIVPNPLLQSEHGWSAELGIRQGWALWGIQGMTDISFFQSRYFDMMEFVLNNQLQFQSKNIGNTQIKGFELETTWSGYIGSWKLQTTMGYTYIDPVYREFDLKGKQLAINEREFAPIGQQNAANSSSYINILKYRSKHLFRCDITTRYKNFYFGYAFQYVSHVEAIDWLFQVTLFIQGINQFRSEHDHGYRIHDLHMGFEFGHWTLQLNLNNALNEAYTVRPGLMEAPRNLGLKWTFNF